MCFFLDECRRELLILLPLLHLSFLESLHERLPLSTPAVSNTTVCREVSVDQMFSQQNPCPLFL